MRELTHLSLFTGFGGIDLAAEWAGFTTVGQCEYADYPFRVLEKHFPGVPRWRDVCELTAEDFYERTGLRTVDLVSGGYPCQPFSQAGKRGGAEDDRYLWPEMFRIIKSVRPAFVLGENVAGHISLGLDATLSDLESTGYKARTFVIPACAVQAPHERSRVFVVAYDTTRGFGKWRRDEKCGVSAWTDTECERVCRYVSDTDRIRQQQSGGEQPESGGRACDRCKEVGILSNTVCHGRKQTGKFQSGKPCKALRQAPERELSGADSALGIPKHDGGEWWGFEPGVGRMAYGVSDRVERLKGLGNAVVPYQVYPITEAIAWILREADL